MYTSASGDVKLSVQVYRFDSMEAFLASLQEYEQLPAWAGVTREAFVTDTTGLDQVASRSTRTSNASPSSARASSSSRQPLPAGFYLVRSEFNDQPIQSWLQVTDVATYAALAQDRTLVWVNDLSTQAPLAGARVEFIGADVSGETGADGTLTLDTPEQSVQTRPIDSGYIEHRGERQPARHRARWARRRRAAELHRGLLLRLLHALRAVRRGRLLALHLDRPAALPADRHGAVSGASPGRARTRAAAP